MRPVRFFLAGERDLDRLRRIDPDRDWRELVTGERAWILQTYLRLESAGDPVELVDRAPEEGLVVFHAKQERALRRSIPPGGRPVLVGARADNRQPLGAEFEVLQNARWEDGRRRFFVPHWPQPGLRARDPARGERVERLAFKGFEANLAPAFRAPEWPQRLAELGVEWIADAIEFRGAATDRDASGWADFGDLDAICAVRPARRDREHSKPATKLVNAWLAGVVAILGDEPAYRELRRSELDYLVARNPEEALAAVARLRSEPGLFRSMVEHGRRRAAEFDVDAVTGRWRELLLERLPGLASAPRAVAARRLPLGLRRALRWAARTAAGRPPR